MIEKVKIGDLIVVCFGEKILVDGKIKEGFFIVDESMVIGESVFVEKKFGDEVIGVIIN